MKNLILLLAGLFFINLTAHSLETLGLQTFKSVPSDETEMVESVTTLHVTAGQLSTVLTAEQLYSITSLTLTGTVDARDFKTMRDEMSVSNENTLKNGLIAHFPFNGNTNDESGNSNHGTAYGAELTFDRFGNENSAYHFPYGSNSYIIGNYMNIISNDMNEFSITCWVKFDENWNSDLGSARDIFIIGNSQTDGLILRGWDVNGFMAGREYIGSVEYFLESNYNYSKWYFVTYVYKNNENIIYVEGDHVGSKYFPVSVPQNGIFVIGRSFPDFGFPNSFSGSIDDIRVYNRALTFEEINSLFNQEEFPIEEYAVYDIDGNGYNTIRIGNQTWLKQNLYVTKFNDGTPIPNVTDGKVWSNLETPAYSWYNNDKSYGSTYGAYYNWYVVDPLSNGGKNVCPEGYKIPGLNDWHELANFLGGRDVAGGKMKVTGTDFWNEPNAGATNESGFSALGASSRQGFADGGFSVLNGDAQFWTTEEAGETNAYQQWIVNYLPWLQWSNGTKKSGNSCRCIKDNSIALTYVPDDNFEQALIDLGYDSGPLDDYVPTANISGLTILDVSGKGIEDLTGIEDFVSLQTLNCANNNLKTIDLSKNINLTVILFYNNQLTSLDVSKNSLLQQMYGNNNYITSLDLSQNPNLNTLDFGNNKLTSLDLSNNPLLSILNCSSNIIPSIDLSKNTKLLQIGVSGNPISTLDISNNKNLKWFYFSRTNLTEIDCSQHSTLESIDCADNILLTSLNLQNGNNVILKTIFVVRNPNLNCIQVDDPITAITKSDWIIDQHASYSTNCSPSPAVIYPSESNIEWNNGQTYNITWSDFPGYRVKIDLMRGTAVLNTIVASTPNDGSHPWTIPGGLESGDDFRILITSVEDRSVTDVSDNFFTIRTLADPLLLVPSESGLIWNNNKTYNITWNGFTGSKVRIELLKGNIVRSTIAASTANDGIHPWTIAKNLESGSDYKIRVTSTENRSVTDISDYDFTIQPSDDKPGKKSAEIEISQFHNHEKQLLIYPNPFTDKVNFEIMLKEPAQVVLEIYTIAGLKLSTLFNGKVEAGMQNRFEYNPEKVPAQVLLYKLRIGDILETGKLIYKP